MSKPPFTITTKMLNQVARLSEQLGKFSVVEEKHKDLRLRKVNQIKTIQGTLAIEGNELTEAQITAIISGKRVLAPVKEVQEAKNAIDTYTRLLSFNSTKEEDLLAAHKSLMLGLIDSAGRYRSGGAGVYKNDQLIHMAPQASLVPKLMEDLFNWLKEAEEHPLIKSCVFHYEFEFIHPFADGNGRVGRLWQTLILAQWQPLFAYLPVENLIHQHQDAYYDAINQSTAKTNSSVFIEFMLSMIELALNDL